MNHKEEDEGSQMNFSSYFSNSEIFCQEEIWLFDSTERQNDISFEIYEKNQVVNSEILNEVVDVLVGNCHEHSLHGSFEDQFNKVLEKLQFEHPWHGKQMT